jgi:hypothetical protein
MRLVVGLHQPVSVAFEALAHTRTHPPTPHPPRMHAATPHANTHPARTPHPATRGTHPARTPHHSARAPQRAIPALYPCPEAGRPYAWCPARADLVLGVVHGLKLLLAPGRERPPALRHGGLLVPRLQQHLRLGPRRPLTSRVRHGAAWAVRCVRATPRCGCVGLLPVAWAMRVRVRRPWFCVRVERQPWEGGTLSDRPAARGPGVAGCPWPWCSRLPVALV